MFAGQNGREGPNYGAVPIASHSAAMALVRGAVAALYVRDRTGQGQRVETSLLQTITPYDLRDWIIWQRTPGSGAAPPRPAMCLSAPRMDIGFSWRISWSAYFAR